MSVGGSWASQERIGKPFLTVKVFIFYLGVIPFMHSSLVRKRREGCKPFPDPLYVKHMFCLSVCNIYLGYLEISGTRLYS